MNLSTSILCVAEGKYHTHLSEKHTHFRIAFSSVANTKLDRI